MAAVETIEGEKTARNFVPARPNPPRHQVGLARALIQPTILTNLIASFPEAWYRERFSSFRIGVSPSGRGVVVNDTDAVPVVGTKAGLRGRDQVGVVSVEPATRR